MFSCAKRVLERDIVVLHAVPEWRVDDGIRSLKDPTNFNTRFCDLLKELGIPYVEIPPSVRDIWERVSHVKAHLCSKYAQYLLNVVCLHSTSRRQHEVHEQSLTYDVPRYRWRIDTEEDMGQYVMITA